MFDARPRRHRIALWYLHLPQLLAHLLPHLRILHDVIRCYGDGPSRRLTSSRRNQHTLVNKPLITQLALWKITAQNLSEDCVLASFLGSDHLHHLRIRLDLLDLDPHPLHPGLHEPHGRDKLDRDAQRHRPDDCTDKGERTHNRRTRPAACIDEFPSHGPFRVVDVVVRPAVAALREHIRGEREIDRFQVEDLVTAAFHNAIQPLTHDCEFLLDDGDVRDDARLAEEWVERAASFSMHLVLNRHAAGGWHGESTRPPCPLVQLETVQLVKEVRIVDVHVVGIRADHGAVLLVHLLDLPYVLMTLEHVVVCFVPVCRDGEFGPWKLGQRVEPDTINRQDQVVDDFGNDQIPCEAGPRFGEPKCYVFRTHGG